MSALDNQVGGSHYMSNYQPIQYASGSKYNAIQLNVLKYVTRHKKKNGKEDLLKAIQYCELAKVYPFPKTSEWHDDKALRYTNTNFMEPPIGVCFLYALDRCDWDKVEDFIQELIDLEYGETKE